MIGLLRDESAGIRHNACRVLARHGATAAALTLIRLLRDPARHVRKAAQSAIEQIDLR